MYTNTCWERDSAKAAHVFRTSACLRLSRRAAAGLAAAVLTDVCERESQPIDSRSKAAESQAETETICAPEARTH